MSNLFRKQKTSLILFFLRQVLTYLRFLPNDMRRLGLTPLKNCFLLSSLTMEVNSLILRELNLMSMETDDPMSSTATLLLLTRRGAVKFTMK